MSKKQIKIVCKKVFCINDIHNKTLNQICIMFNEIMNRYGKDSVARFNDYMYDIESYRLETNEEYNNRKKKNERSKELRMKRKIKEIERLENKLKKLKQKYSTRK